MEKFYIVITAQCDIGDDISSAEIYVPISVDDGKIVFTKRMKNGGVGYSGGSGAGKYYIELNDVVVNILRNIENLVKSITKDKLSSATDTAKHVYTCKLPLDLSEYISDPGFDVTAYLDYEDVHDEE